MNHTIIRAQPAAPKVEEIVLRLTPAEFVRILRGVGHTNSLENTPGSCETRHDIVQALDVLSKLERVAVDAGIARLDTWLVDTAFFGKRCDSTTGAPIPFPPANAYGEY
jgi:hypothetical protein